MNNLFANVLSSTRIPILIINKVNGQIINVNKAACNLFNLSSSQICKTNINSIFHQQNFNDIKNANLRTYSFEWIQKLSEKHSQEFTVFVDSVCLDENQYDLYFMYHSTSFNPKMASVDSEQAQRYINQVQNSLDSTMVSIKAMSELHDSYTVDHEQRVANIAVAIANEMGISADQQEGIRVSAYLHDIGKIGIPSEILTKPRKLSEAEYILVKEHPKLGYDILKNMNFPWPVLNVILEHHERWDGSGYPNGLMKEEITFEARIVAVADVIESMSTSRPYRFGLGIDAALAEIQKGRALHYDPDVVDACLNIFRLKNYQLPSDH